MNPVKSETPNEPARTEDGWFKEGKWYGKPALCRRVSVRVGPPPGNRPFFWSNLRMGKLNPAIEIVVIKYKRERVLVKGVPIKRTIPVFGEPFFIDNDGGYGQKLVLEMLTPKDELYLKNLPGTDGGLFRRIYPKVVIVEKP